MPSLSRYETLGIIGENHYARFHKGYDHKGDRHVCIIEFLEKFRANEERWQQIWQQILAAGRIKHDYLVSVYDYDQEQRWVITELMQGSLRDQKPESLKDFELVRTVLYRTLETLDYLHLNHHPHGDVRPANLLFDNYGRTKLSYSPGISLGGQIPRRQKDYAFLPPEMFDSTFGDVGIGVDLYGCGMSALSLLLGDDFAPKLLGVAISDDVAWQRFHRDVNSHPSVRALLPTLPQDMETVIQKLISKKVDQRYTSIAEARQLLRRPDVEVKIQVQEVRKEEPVKGPKGPGMPPVITGPLKFEHAFDSNGPSHEPPTKKPHPARIWVQEKLKNPYVLGLISAFVMSMIVFAIVIVSALRSMSDSVKVAVSTAPPGATISIDDQKQEEVTDAELSVSPGTHKFLFELTGFQPITKEFEIPEGDEIFKAPLVPLVAVVTEKKHQPTPVKPLPQTTPAKPPAMSTPTTVAAWKLPDGLESVGKEIDKATQLPRRVNISRLKQELHDSDVPLTFILLPKGELTFKAVEPLETGELPVQEVSIKSPFYISENELTQAQLMAYRKLSGSVVTNALTDELRNQPAIGVSFTEAGAVCKWLGTEFDLPSEQEWQWAASGPAGRTFPWGNELPSADFVNIRHFAVKKTTTIPTVAVSELDKGKTQEGVRHLLGNAAEWCRDVYTPGHAEGDQTTGVGRLHVIRGGSFRSPASGLIRVTWRANAPDSGANDVGVRMVCHPKPPVP
jgi:formylglycine-generating enzyme required for sulfatase activity/serine/threonine protein kinase